MTRDLAYEIAREAIKKASGRSMSEAVKIIAETILSVGKPEEEAFVVAEEPVKTEDPNPPPTSVIPKPKITELAPIRVSTTPPRSVVRVRHSSEEMQEAVLDNMPAALEVLPQGHKEPLTLYRSMMADAGNPPSLQVVYKFKDHDAEAPYVKVFLWSTDEKAWDFPAIMAKLKSDAESMYRLRTNAVRTSVVNLGPVESRFAKRENV